MIGTMRQAKHPAFVAGFFMRGRIGNMAYLPIVGVTIGIVLGLLVAAQRFSLRTSLIATTFVALVLGLVAYAMRK